MGIEKFTQREIKKHEFVTICLVLFLVVAFVTEFQIDSASCSKNNPNFDCSQRGTIDISQLQGNKSWTQTTGFGLHYNGFNALPEFRHNFQHAVCDLGNSTCRYHFDTYQATNFPFGFVLHEADTLQLFGLFDETTWIVLIWIGLIVLVYFIGRFTENVYDDLAK